MSGLFQVLFKPFRLNLMILVPNGSVDAWFVRQKRIVVEAGI